MSGVSVLSGSCLAWGDPALGSLQALQVNGKLQEGLRQGGPSSAPIPVVSPCQPTPPQEALQH